MSYGKHSQHLLGLLRPRTPLEAMHHSQIDLTMKLYTDPIPTLLDVVSAVNTLPEG